MTDDIWVAIRKLVAAGLADADLLNNPPTSSEDVGAITDTITDHVVAAFTAGDLSRRSRWWNRHA